MRAAYAEIAGVADEWSEATVGFAGHSVLIATLEGAPEVSVAFMRLPDGGYPSGTGYSLYGNESLRQLWHSAHPCEGCPEKSTIAAVDESATYDYEELLETLVAEIESFGPSVIVTQDYTVGFGSADHPDHTAGAYFSALASEAYEALHQVVSLEGYEDLYRAQNVFGGLLESKQQAFYAYGEHDSATCASAEACEGTEIESWLERQYVTDYVTLGSEAEIGAEAAATASSETPEFGQTAAKAIDGQIDGYPGDPTARGRPAAKQPVLG